MGFSAGVVLQNGRESRKERKKVFHRCEIYMRGDSLFVCVSVSE
jgi:hypothetical protein